MSKLPDIKINFPDWYQEVVYQADLADQAPVRGCIIIKPYGNAIWEQIKSVLDRRIKETGHENAIFPLLIPQSFIEKEADHIEGFAPELAVVTHAGGKKLEEPLVVRPTSETMIHYMFAKWLKSYRDLPIKINQWANVMRWEKRPRAFLRTSEFFWQEGHTAHATKEEALEEALLMLNEYVKLAQDYLAIPVLIGRKSPSEQFAGAEATYTYEAFMLDGKAVQMGTSHLLSQNFAKSFDMKYQDKDGKIAYPYLTSWGTTTRLVGAVIASHGDQKGLILPPKIAPIQVVIVPIFKSDEQKDKILSKAFEIKSALLKNGIRVHIDDQDHLKPGAKYFKWELRGVPARIELGMRDIENNVAIVAARTHSEKETVNLDVLTDYIAQLLDTIQNELFKRAEDRYQAMWHIVEKLTEFGPQLEKESGIYQTGWCMQESCERELKKYKATTRCLLEHEKKLSTCFHCDRPSLTDVIVAKSY